MMGPNGQPFGLPPGMVPLPGMMPMHAGMGHMQPGMHGHPVAFGAAATQLRAAAREFVPGGPAAPPPPPQQQTPGPPAAAAAGDGDGDGDAPAKAAAPQGGSPRGIVDHGLPAAALEEADSGQSASDDSVAAPGEDAELPPPAAAAARPPQPPQGNGAAHRPGQARAVGQITPPPPPPPAPRPSPPQPLSPDVRRLKLVR
jgi:hypothetical protein